MEPLPNGVLSKINALQFFDLSDLLRCYAKVMGEPPKCRRSDILRRRIAYRYQEMFYDAVTDPDTTGELEKVAESPNLDTSDHWKIKKTGTAVTRFWKGVRHTATKAPDGTWDYDGKNYGSLSAVASAITGTKRNGKVFFHIKGAI